MSKFIDILNKQYFGDNPHEKEILCRLPELLKGVTSFVDLGASLGQYTKAVNSIMQEGIITAIEADPIRAEILRSNCKRWEQESTNNIHVIEGAVDAVDGNITFYSPGTNRSGSTVITSHIKGCDLTEISVSSYCLDSLFPDPPDFIKLDVEGGEFKALLGARQILSVGHPLVLIEFHTLSLRFHCNNLLNTLGYAYEALDSRHYLYTRQQ